VYIEYIKLWHSLHLSFSHATKARFPLSELTAHELGCIFWHPSWRVSKNAPKLITYISVTQNVEAVLTSRIKSASVDVKLSTINGLHMLINW